MTELMDTPDMIDPAEANEAIEPSDAKDPIDPTESAEPMDPIDSTDPVDPIDRTEPLERIDRIDLGDSEAALASVAEEDMRLIVAPLQGATPPERPTVRPFD